MLRSRASSLLVELVSDSCMKFHALMKPEDLDPIIQVSISQIHLDTIL